MTGGPILNSRVRGLLLTLGALTALLGLVSFFFSTRLYPLFLFWNIFLACLPVLFAGLVLWAERRKTHRRLLTALFFLLWLVFFPNGPYMVTDLIYLNYYNYTGGPMGYTTEFTAWLGLLQIFLAVLIGAVLGCLSLYWAHTLVCRRFGAAAGWAFCIFASLLSGAAIYLGRVLRFNSWDLLMDPGGILGGLSGGFGRNFIALGGVFTLLTLCPYLLFYACFHRPAEGAGPKN